MDYDQLGFIISKRLRYYGYGHGYGIFGTWEFGCMDGALRDLPFEVETARITQFSY